MDVEILCKGRWIGPAHASPTEALPTEVEVLCKARWIVVGPAALAGARP